MKNLALFSHKFVLLITLLAHVSQSVTLVVDKTSAIFVSAMMMLVCDILLIKILYASVLLLLISILVFHY